MEGLFLAEGGKNLHELLEAEPAFRVEHLYIFKDYYPKISEKLRGVPFPVTELTLDELQSISTLEENRHGLAVLYMKETAVHTPAPGSLVLALDGIRDPGNLGTIVRTAEWFGVSQIWASKDTAEFFNPKTIMATMGSFLRLQVSYCDLGEVLREMDAYRLGAALDGEPLSVPKTDKPIVLAIGSESHGLRPEVVQALDQTFKIEGFGKAESLNAGVAAGISLFALRTAKGKR